MKTWQVYSQGHWFKIRADHFNLVDAVALFYCGKDEVVGKFPLDAVITLEPEEVKVKKVKKVKKGKK